MDLWTAIVGTFERLRRSLLRIVDWFVRRRRGFVRVEYDSSFTFEEAGPPEHWVERVRQGAPGLLEPSLRQRARPTKRKSERTETVLPEARREGTETVLPEARQFPVETPEPRQTETVLPEAKQFPLDTPEPGSPQANRVPEVDVPPKQRARLRGLARAHSAEPVPEALAEAVLERPLEPAQPAPPRVARVRALDARAKTRTERRLGKTGKGSPSAERAPVEPPPDTQPERPTERAPDALSPDDRRLGSEPHPWPDLPPPFVPHETGLDLALRAWERERRLDREQAAL